MSRLSGARDQTGRVLTVERVGSHTLELTAELPHLAQTVRAGQFAQLRCGVGVVPLLRRPFSVSMVDGDNCRFVFEQLGAGTVFLGGLRPGHSLTALGPLGRPFTIEPAPRHAVCVAGGLGCAPFPLLAAQLRAAGCARVTILSGAASADRLYPASHYGEGVTVLESTDDGSAGHHGRVTELLAQVMSDGVDAVYGCGPNPMLASMARELLQHGVPAVAEVALEAPMGCGFGTCLGCAVPTTGREALVWGLCCTDGPVFPTAAVDWEVLAASREVVA
jgi:dihydroorotate dehydrogenase electron transfer subunit